MSSEKADDIIREEAAVWLARIRGGINGSEERAFQQWYASDRRLAHSRDRALWLGHSPRHRTPVPGFGLAVTIGWRAGGLRRALRCGRR